MSYGLSATNNGGSVVISSDYKILVFSERGSFQIVSRYSDGEGYGSVIFIKPINTLEAPQIFVRCVSASHPALSFYTRVLGSPGNWTGFSVVSSALGGGALQNFNLEYVSCKYSDKKSIDPYGLEIYDRQEGIVYTSSDRVVRYSKFTKRWSYVPPQIAYGRVAAFNSNLAIDNDDFISISSIDRGNAWFMGSADYAGLRIREGGAPTVKILINLNRPDIGLYQGTAGAAFSIPVCKFPISRYYN